MSATAADAGAMSNYARTKAAGEQAVLETVPGDVAEPVSLAVDAKAKLFTVYELGGPDVLSFRQCLEKVLAATHRKRPLVTIPFGLAELGASLTGWLPGAPLTRDQVELLKSDNVVSAAAAGEGRTLAGLGIAPESADVILPTYLYRFMPHGQYDRTNKLA